jgi:hypothetical protein
MLDNFHFFKELLILIFMGIQKKTSLVLDFFSQIFVRASIFKIYLKKE